MNFYHALNNGDGSLKEPHFTSILHYIFTQSLNKGFPSFLEYFLKANLNLSLTDFEALDIEGDILIEQILSVKGSRKDCDITIFLKNNNEKIIVNIENKISINSFHYGQVDEQNKLLKQKYTEYEVLNILLLPFESNFKILDDSITKVIYWHGGTNSLLQQINDYGKLLSDNQIRVKQFLDFFEAFGIVLEQQYISLENSERGPRNNYPLSMYDYLKQISDNWDNYFNNEDVTINQLLKIFERVVSQSINDLKINDDEKKDMMNKFRRGALEAQPKIMTINEKNRIHFGVTDRNMKALFYYPERLDGIIDSTKWKNRKIMPLTKKRISENPIVFWKDKETSEIVSEIYLE